MKQRIILNLLIFLFIQQSVNAKVLFVPQQYSTIQSAIDASNSNDTVLISPGIYYENISFNGKPITVKGDGSAESVTIDGNRNSGSVVTFSSGETSSSILDELTITGGKGTATSNGIIGGGIFLMDGTSPQIKNCIIKDNSASLGGGIGQWSSTGTSGSPAISFCLIYNNSANSYGGGIWYRASNGSIINCTIVQNSASEASNITFTSFASGVTVTNSIIWFGSTNGLGNYNYCDIQGGLSSGVGNINDDPVFCDINSDDFHLAANSPCIGSGQNGTNIGAYGKCSSTVTLFNYPLTTSTNWTYNYSYNYSYMGTMKNIISIRFWTIVDSSYDGNITQFKFRAINCDTTISSSHYPPYFDTSYTIDTSNFYIERLSSMIIVKSPKTFHGNSDTLSGFFDGLKTVEFRSGDINDNGTDVIYKEGVGLISYQYSQTTNTRIREKLDLTEFNGSIVNVKNVDHAAPLGYYLNQNYPNPFNPNTTIEYSIPKQSHVTLKVFDLLGKEVATLVNGEKPVGNYKVDFNSRNLPSGIYFYRIEADRYSATQKLLLLK